MNLIRVTKLAIGFAGIILFYSTIHEHAYYVLFEDRICFQ